MASRDRNVKRLMSLRDTISGFMAQGFQDHKPFEWFLEQRSRRVHSHPEWKKLPRWAHEQLNGHFSGAIQLIESTLYWTLLLNDERMSTAIPEQNERMEGHWEEINAQNNRGNTVERMEGNCGMHCYLLPTGEWLPYRETDREAERVRLAKLGN